jgi:DNA-binding beta-propeller fold protein YncE
MSYSDLLFSSHQCYRYRCFLARIFSYIAASTTSIYIPYNAKWKQIGITVAGGNGPGGAFDQLDHPCDLDIDDDGTLYIADYGNHRIVSWRRGATSGLVAAGGNGPGAHTNQLNHPTSIIVDKKTHTLIICDMANRRVVRWAREGGIMGQMIISGIPCWDLKMDADRYLYISDYTRHTVKRWRVPETRTVVVAGGNGEGDRYDQLRYPHFIFIDQHRSVYISDWFNHRVIKWVNGATHGIIVAGGFGEGNSLSHLSRPEKVIVDHLGTVYIVDSLNDRVIRWQNGARQGSVVVGENGRGKQANQLKLPTSLSFDRQGNLYVVDSYNNRVQKFSIDTRL